MGSNPVSYDGMVSHRLRLCMAPMVVCRSPQFQVTPVAPSTPGGGLGVRTACVVEGHTLFNLLEWLEWDCERLQLIVCEACGDPDCTVSENASVRRSGEEVYLLPVDTSNFAEWEHEQYGTATLTRRQGPIVIPRIFWDELSERCPALPPMEHIPPMERRSLARGWMSEVAQLWPEPTPDALLTLIAERSYGSGMRETKEIVSFIQSLLGWVEKAPTEALAGALIPASECRADIETIYFDGPAKEDWPGLGWVDGQVTFAFRGGRVWFPPPAFIPSAG